MAHGIARPRRTPPSPARLVRHILENPDLVAAVRQLPAAGLGRLIDAVGLEEAGELVALASTEQLASVFDEDLWSAETAHDDPRFDSARFALWLEVLWEAGEGAVVERLCELPLDFVTLAVHRSILVLDIDALAVQMSEFPEDLASTEKALESCLYEEWEEFRLVSRHAASWDVVLDTLLALDRDHHELLRQILERCCHMSSEFIAENGGLYDVLTSDEMLESDVRAERDDRRAARGYVAPSDARSFLALARSGAEEGTRDAITRAYFRELGTLESRAAAPVAAAGGSISRLMKLLHEAGLGDAPVALRRSSKRVKALPASDRALTAPRPGAKLERALSELRQRASEVYAARLEELSYLANVLVSGWVEAGRRLRPIEALELALDICEAAFEESKPLASVTEVLETTHLDQLFRKGYRRRAGVR